MESYEIVASVVIAIQMMIIGFYPARFWPKIAIVILGGAAIIFGSALVVSGGDMSYALHFLGKDSFRFGLATFLVSSGILETIRCDQGMDKSDAYYDEALAWFGSYITWAFFLCCLSFYMMLSADMNIFLILLVMSVAGFIVVGYCLMFALATRKRMVVSAIVLAAAVLTELGFIIFC